MKLLFIPGSGAGREAWKYQTEYFIDSEAVALPGHPQGELYSSIDDYVEWLRDYIHQHRYEDVVLVGHSFGSAVAQLFGLEYGEDIKALVLIGAGARLRVLPAFLEMVEGMITAQASWSKFLEELYGFVAPEIRQAVMEERMRMGPAVMLSDLLCCDKFDIMDKVHDIKLPTLVICGSKDEMTPVKYANYLASRIEGARRIIVDGAGHLVFLEKPKEVNQAIKAFLASLG